MPPLPLPPRGVFVPTALVYAKGLSAAAFHTWVALRGLALKGDETPPCTVQDLASLTGKSPSALYGHLAMLKSRGALRWRSTGRGVLTIVFEPLAQQADLPDGIAGAARAPASAKPRRSSDGDPDGEPWPDAPVGPASEPPDEPPGQPPGDLRAGPHPAGLDSRNPEHRFQESGRAISPSFNSINTETQERGGREAGGFQVSGTPPAKFQVSGAGAKTASQAPAPSQAVAIYQELTGRRPNKTQRQELFQVSDLELWRSSLDHWQIHGWNPANLAGILDLYHRGGPSACRYCGKAGPEASKTARPRMLDVIDQVRQDHPHGRKP